MKKIIILVFSAVLALALLTACGQKAEEPAAVQAESTIQTSSAIIAEGRLLPANALELSFNIPGIVSEVFVSDGDTVTQGQVLATLSVSPEAQLALARAEQELLAANQAMEALTANADSALAQARLAVITAQEALEDAQDDLVADDSEENQALFDTASAALVLAEEELTALEAGNGIHPDQLAAAETRLASAEAALASAQAAIDNAELKAEFDGAVVAVNIQPGQRVNVGQSVLALADFSSWVIETDNLTEIEVVNVTEGQSVAVVFDALPEESLTGTIQHINTRYEEKRGDITYTVVIALDNTDLPLRWGMTASVEFLP